MAQPTQYVRSFGFESFQNATPATPLPGSEIDQEFDAVQITMDQVRANMAKVLDDDDTFLNESIGYLNLTPALRALIPTMTNPTLNLDNVPLYYGTFDLFRALSADNAPGNDRVIFLAGNASVGDGDGGYFRWDASSTVADDDINTLKITAVTTGRAVRIAVAPAGQVIPEEFLAIGDGTNNDQPALVSANATGRMIILTGTYRVASNLTLDVPLVFAGGQLKPDTGVTITINGQIVAGLTQIFNLQGTAVISRSFLRPEWFGGTTDTDIQAALNGCSNYSAGEVRCDSASYTLSATVSIPSDVCLNMAPGSFLQPDGNHNVVQVNAASRFIGKIRTDSVSGWNSNAIYVLGSADYNFSKPTKIDAVLIGGKGTSEGTALQLYAADTSGHRVMNVKARIEVDGFSEGFYIHKDGTALTSFVNANVLVGSFSETDRALLMESDHASDFGIDGHKITYSHQPRSGTTKPSATLAGQSQSIECWPYDWSTVAATSAYAVVMGSAFRTSDVTIYQQALYVQNNSTDRGNIIRVMDNVGAGGLYASLLESNSADGFFRFRATDPHLENTRGIHFRNAADSGDYKVLSVDANDDVLLRITGSGNNIIFDSANQILGRVGGSATWTIDSNGRYIWTNGTGFNGFPTHANTADRVWTYPDQSGTLTIRVAAAPATPTSAGVVGEWFADTTHFYVCVAANTWRRVSIGAGW